MAYTPIGNEFKVNAPFVALSGSTIPDVAVAANGDFVVVWEHFVSSGNRDIHFRLFNADGTPKSSGDGIVSTNTLNDTTPRVDMAPDGRFVITFVRRFSTDTDVVFQRYSATGVPQGALTSVPTTDVNTKDQFDPDVAMSADGSFGIVWTHEFSSTDLDVFYRGYNASGSPLTAADVIISNSGGVNESQPSITRRPTALGGGTMQVISWTRDEDVFFRRITAAGTGQGSATRANVSTFSTQDMSSVAMDDAGNFVITWFDASGAGDIRFRQFTGSGTPLTSTDRTVSNAGGIQDLPDVHMASNGRFVVAFLDNADSSVKYREFSPSGVAGPIRRYDVFHNNETNPAVALSPSGHRMVIVADDDRTHSSDPYARVFRGGNTPGDYDGDGKTDIAVYGYGRLAYKPSGSPGAPDRYLVFGGPEDRPLSGDYDGDGKADLAVYGYGRHAYRPSGSPGAPDRYFAFGGPEDLAVAGDYDGDGRTDIAVYGYGRFAYIASGDPGGFHRFFPFGGPEDRPVSGDYDGDGKTDLAVYGYGRFAYRPSGSPGAPDRYFSFGGTEDRPVTGDFDGDGKTDVAVYGYGRLAYIASSDPNGFHRFIPFGGTEDVPLVGDYDGDGRSDLAVYGYGRHAYRPSGSPGAPDRYLTFGGTADTGVPQGSLVALPFGVRGKPASPAARSTAGGAEWVVMSLPAADRARARGPIGAMDAALEDLFAPGEG